MVFNHTWYWHRTDDPACGLTLFWYHNFVNITMTSQWRQRRFKSPASPLFTQPLIQGADQRKHQSSTSLAFLRGIHRWPVNSPHKGQWRGKCFHLTTSSRIVNHRMKAICSIIQWSHFISAWVHYIDVIMATMASQITSLTVVYSTVYSGVDQRKHQSSASLAFVRGVHRGRWIPRTEGQLRGNCFYLMTSSCLLRGLGYRGLSQIQPSELPSP